MKPRDFFHALHGAAREPGTVSQLCERAQVGKSAGRYTASRMLARGDLVVLQPGRPAVLVAAELAPAVAPCGDSMGYHLQVLHQAFWDID